MAKTSKETRKNWQKDPNNWKYGIFYYNPSDDCIFPPKRISEMGWTINFANPRSILAFVGILCFFISITLLITFYEN